MNRDLEAQLCEMGDAYRAVVDRLRAGREAEKPVVKGGTRTAWATGGWLVAASVVLCLGMGVLFNARLADSRQSTADGGAQLTALSPQPSASSEYRLALIRSEAAVKEMIRSQRADGGWRNDFLTRQNAAALKGVATLEAQIAYKKALRNLRVRGLL